MSKKEINRNVYKKDCLTTLVYPQSNKQSVVHCLILLEETFQDNSFNKQTKIIVSYFLSSYFFINEAN